MSTPTPAPGAAPTPGAAPAIDPATMYPMPSGDPEIKTKLMIPIWTMMAVTFIFVMLRMYCRAIRTRTTSWDDYLLVIGFLMLLTAGALLQNALGNGYLYTSLSGPTISPINLASESVIKLSLAMVKTSFAITLLRFATGWPRWAIIVVTALTDVSCFAHAILVWKATCGPSPIVSYKIYPCWSSYGAIWTNMVVSIISAFGDFVYTLIPITIIWYLQMNKREKIGVTIAMSIGIIAGVIGIAKAVQSYQITNVVGRLFAQRVFTLSILIHAETDAAIIAASIPVLRILFKDMSAHFSSNRRTGANSNNYLKSNDNSRFHNGPGSSAVDARATRADNDNDNGSETSILQDEKVPAGIKQTRQITIEYDNNSHYSSYGETEAIEMQNCKLPSHRQV